MRRKLALLHAAAGGAALPLSCTKQFHARLIVAAPCIADDHRLRLLRSYAAHGEFAPAHRLLDEAPRPASPLLYNAVIRAHSRRGDLPTALAFFASMRRSATPPDAHTFACVLRACADCSPPGAAKILHGIAPSSGWSSHPTVGSAPVSAYSKFLLVDSARHVFDGLREPDLVLWNSMMSGYGYREMWLEGLQLFSAMRRAGAEPDGYSMVSLLSSFWDPEALAFGQAVHGVCVKGGYDSGHHVRSTLVSMYFRCGCVESGQTLFGSLLDADLVTCCSLITGQLQTGKYEESFNLFREMCYSGRRPDSILIASLLSASASTASISCSKEIHGYAVRVGVDKDIKVSSSLMDAYANVVSRAGIFGLLDEGWKLFRRMRDEFHIVVEMQHYVYMVRLLATFNQLKEAYDLIQTMPMPPDCGVWGALLWGCCVHRDSSLGRAVAEKLFEFYPDKASYKIMLSNLYASEGMWWDAEEVRAEMSKEDMHKNTGISWVGEISK
ncbi:hypothetical protein ZWY2020_051603 [Hordeum vulgare]|nr:hypothetical protein ZWY2020_051603 [Hordeum vulgare]